MANLNYYIAKIRAGSVRHDIFLLLCVCTTRVLHMFTQADLLIVNHGHIH